MSATATAPVSEVTLSAGDAAIISAAAPGANVATLLKAIWSTRGFLRVNYGPLTAFGGLSLIKSDVTGALKNLPGDAPAPYILQPAKGGAYLVPVDGVTLL